MIYRNIETLTGEICGMNFNFKVLKIPKKIFLLLSGGTDSALLFYLLCKYIDENKIDTTITPFTLIDTRRPGNDFYTNKIINFMRHTFKSVNINDNVIRYITKINTHDKKKLTKEQLKLYFSKNNYELSISALTSFPSQSELEKNKELYNQSLNILTEDRTKTETKKTGPMYEKENNTYWYFPFINIDKKDVAKMYEEYDLMDNLFPITQSCVGYPKHTKNGTEPCKTCFWCLEKYWAFGLFDYPKNLINDRF